MNLASTAIEKTAKMLGDNYNIKVIFRGNECCTDGRMIYLPVLNDKMPLELIKSIRMFLDHEVGHILFSDFKVVKRRKSKLAAAALNVVEDIRIEREVEKIWKGSVINFERGYESLAKKVRENNGIDLVGKIFTGIILHERWEYGDDLINELYPEIFPFLAETQPIVDEIQEAKDTEDAYTIAKKLLKALKKFSEEEPKPDLGKKEDGKKKKAKKGESGDPDEDQDKGLKDGDGSAEESEPLENSENEGSGGKAEEENKRKKGEKNEEAEDMDGEGADEMDGEGDISADDTDADTETKYEAADDKVGVSGNATDDLTDLKKAVKDSLDKPTKPIKSGIDIETLISEDALDSIDFKEWTPYGTDIDTFEPPDMPDVSDAELLTHYQATVQENMKGSSSVLKNQMKRILISEKRCKWVGGKQKGVINPTTLAAAAKGTSKSIYRQRKIGKKVNSTVSILVDLSASMGWTDYTNHNGENKMTVARNTAILLAETLNGLVPFEILGFSGDRRSYPSSCIKDAKSFSRWGSLDMIYFKKFEETFGNEAKKRLISMNAMAENYDGESVQFAAKRLLDQPEQKKILFVLSDGTPCAGRCDYTKLGPHLKGVVEDLSKIDNLHIVAFGIKTEAPKHFYPNHVIINDPAKDLAETVMGELNKILT